LRPFNPKKSLLNKNWPSFTLTLIVPFTIVSKFYCTIWIASNWYRTYRTQRRRAPKYRIKDCRFDSFELRIAQNCYFFTIFGFYNLQLPLATKKQSQRTSRRIWIESTQIGSSNYN
jgi:hypothetical protein